MNKTTLKNWEKYCEEVRVINDIREERVEEENRSAKDFADSKNKWSFELSKGREWAHFWWFEREPKKYKFLNLGLRDAYLLAEQLSGLFSKQSHVTKSRNAIDNALYEYSLSRQADRKATIGITDFLARVFTSPLTPVIAARGAALSLLQWLPPVKTGLARQMMFGRR